MEFNRLSRRNVLLPTTTYSSGVVQSFVLSAVLDFPISIISFLVLATDFGKPWLTYEAFQCLLKAQVKSLVELGVDPALKVSRSPALAAQI